MNDVVKTKIFVLMIRGTHVIFLRPISEAQKSVVISVNAKFRMKKNEYAVFRITLSEL